MYMATPLLIYLATMLCCHILVIACTDLLYFRKRMKYMLWQLESSVRETFIVKEFWLNSRKVLSARTSLNTLDRTMLSFLVPFNKLVNVARLLYLQSKTFSSCGTSEKWRWNFFCLDFDVVGAKMNSLSELLVPIITADLMAGALTLKCFSDCLQTERETSFVNAIYLRGLHFERYRRRKENLLVDLCCWVPWTNLRSKHENYDYMLNRCMILWD